MSVLGVTSSSKFHSSYDLDPLNWPLRILTQKQRGNTIGYRLTEFIRIKHLFKRNHIQKFLIQLCKRFICIKHGRIKCLNLHRVVHSPNIFYNLPRWETSQKPIKLINKLWPVEWVEHCPAIKKTTRWVPKIGSLETVGMIKIQTWKQVQNTVHESIHTKR